MKPDQKAIYFNGSQHTKHTVDDSPVRSKQPDVPAGLDWFAGLCIWLGVSVVTGLTVIEALRGLVL